MRFLFIICFAILVCSSGNAQSDTLNRVDANGKKYGYWQVRHKEFYSKKKFNETYLEEEGKYVAGKKEGLWKTYYSDSTLKAEIEYKNNRPNGVFNTYYDNGQIEEEGHWKGTFYVGEFNRFNKNGCIVKSQIFDEKGKSIYSAYYYSTGLCGKLIQEINKDNSGQFIIYDTLGNPIHSDIIGNFSSSKYCFPDYYKKLETLCQCDVNTNDTVYTYWLDYFNVEMKGVFNDKKLFNGKCLVNDYFGNNVFISSFLIQDGKIVLEANPRNVLVLNGDESGFLKLYTKFNQIHYDGEFENGKFMNGKKYFYDYYGFLDKIEIYKGGKYIGDVQMDD